MMRLDTNFCGCDSIQNCLEHDLQKEPKESDKPLYFQGYWWSISPNRDFFFRIDINPSGFEHYEPNPYWLQVPYNWSPQQ